LVSNQQKKTLKYDGPANGQQTRSSTLHLEVLWCIGVRELEPERFRDQDADVRVEPVVSRQILKQKHETLEEESLV